MRIQVITDSSTNVPDAYLARLEIVELPALVNFGAESFLNKVELSAEEFYRRLAAADKLPTTAQPSPKQFAAAYEQAAAEGMQEAIVVVVSGKMSGTLNSAVVAAEHAPIKVHMWDSMNAAMGAGWQAIAAAEMAQAGRDSAAILAELAAIRARMSYHHDAGHAAQPDGQRPGAPAQGQHRRTARHQAGAGDGGRHCWIRSARPAAAARPWPRWWIGPSRRWAIGRPAWPWRMPTPWKRPSGWRRPSGAA